MGPVTRHRPRRRRSEAGLGRRHRYPGGSAPETSGSVELLSAHSARGQGPQHRWDCGRTPAREEGRNPCSRSSARFTPLPHRSARCLRTTRLDRQSVVLRFHRRGWGMCGRTTPARVTRRRRTQPTPSSRIRPPGPPFANPLTNRRKENSMFHNHYYANRHRKHNIDSQS